MGFADALRQRNLMAPVAPPVDAQSFDTFGMPIRKLGLAQPGGGDISAIIHQIEPFLNRQRAAGLEDMRYQQNLMNQAPAISEGRIRNVMDPNQPQNVVFDPGMTEFQKANLSLDKQKLAIGTDLEKQKIDQSGKLGAERLGLQEGALKLNQLKNEQIYETKIADMERKSNEAAARLALAQQQLQGRENDAISRDQLARARIDAQIAKHELDLARKDREIENSTALANARIKALQDAAEAAGYVTEETDLTTDDEGNQKSTKVTKKGPAAKPTVKPNDPLNLRK